MDKPEYPIGSTARIYHDWEGNEVTLLRLIKSDPQWAISRINHLEVTLNNLLNDCINFDGAELTPVFQKEASICLGNTSEGEK